MDTKGKEHFFFTYSDDRAFYDVWKFKNGKFYLTKMVGLKVAPVSLTLSIGLDGNVYAAYDNKLLQLDSTTGESIELLELAVDRITHVYFIQNKAYILTWTNLNEELFVYDFETGKVTPHPVNRFFNHDDVYRFEGILPDEDFNFWLSGGERMLAYYDAVEDSLYKFRPQMVELFQEINDIIYLRPDNTGSFWILTRLGLVKASLQSSAFDQYFNEPSDYCLGNCSFRGIVEDGQGRIYASHYGTGIARLDPAKKKELPHLLTNDFIGPWGLGFFSDSILLGSGRFMHPENGGRKRIPGSFDSDIEAGIYSKAHDGPLWWVHNHELFYLDTTQNTLRWEKELELPHKGGYLTEAMHAGLFSKDLWISHRGRLLRYSPHTNDQKWFDVEDWKIPISRILAIEERAVDELWLATDVGIVFFNPQSGLTQNYTEKDGLANNFVCGMLTEGDSCLWLSTNKGLSRFHIADQSFINFFEEDGLTHNEFNRLSFYKAKDGRMFFGGLRGINAFYPQDVLAENRRRNEKAQVVLSSFEYIDVRKDTSLKQYGFSNLPRVELSHWQRSFTFEYALTDYRKPEEVSYSFQMEGYEDVWSTPSHFNFTRFTSLPAGDYIFRVKARDSHGLWHENQLAVQIIVYPPWWETTSAYLLYILILLGIGYLIFNFLRRRLLLQNELNLKAEETKRLKELDTFKSR
ncbi:MAG: triple tyrosine motif-containing protein, partial [Bacteroidota bacterium]